MSRAARRRRDTPPVEQLLGLLAPLPDQLFVGFEQHRDQIDAFLRPYPHDVRSGAAGMFAFVAPSEWCALGVNVACTARDAVSGSVLATDCVLRLVVTCGGEVASQTLVDGVPIATDDLPAPSEVFDTSHLLLDPSGQSQGPIVDAMHRVLGLACPGEPPELTTLATVVWLHEILEVALVSGHVTWAGAVALHPGDPGPSHIGPSTETLVEALIRSAADSDWERMRRQIADSRYGAHELSAHEARWMDRTMFGRWTLSALPDTDSMLATLRDVGCADVADRFAAVAAAVTDELARTREAGRWFPRTA